MSDFFDNEKDTELNNATEVSAEQDKAAEEIEDDSLSTIFSAPVEKKPNTQKSSNKKRILSVVAAVLALAVVITGTTLVIKLIPKKATEDNTSTQSNEIEVLTLDYKLLDKVTITNQNGSFVFNCDRTVEESDSGEETVTANWIAEGFPEGKLSSLLISDVICTLDNVTATREITTKTADECGLENPSRKIDVESEEYGNFSVIIGGDSPDNSGVYLKLSTKDTIYLVDTDTATAFDFDYLDLADASGFNALETTGLDSYLDTEGNLASFDKLTLSGKNFPTAIVFEPSDDGFLADFIPYKVTSPIKQDADKVSEIMALYINGLVSEGAYSLEVNAEELKKVGLDNPDVVVTIKLGSVTKTFKISKVDDTYCAVIDDNSTLIEKVALEDITFIDYKLEDFYSKWVFLRAIDDVSTMTFEYGTDKYVFDISYTDSEDVKTYNIKLGDKTLTAENFQDFYTEFISLQAADFTVSDTDIAPEMTVTVNYNDGHTETISFIRTAATKYQFNIDGVARGRITSSSYNKIVKYLKLVVQNKAIK